MWSGKGKRGLGMRVKNVLKWDSSEVWATQWVYRKYTIKSNELKVIYIFLSKMLKYLKEYNNKLL